MLANTKGKINVFVNNYCTFISVSIFKKLHFNLLRYV